MSSRRSLRKDINNSILFLYTECFFYKTFVVDANKEKANTLLAEINNVHNTLLNDLNAGNKQPKEKRGAHYKLLRTVLVTEINRLATEINKLD